MSGKYLLKAENVSKSFGPTRAVSNFSMEVGYGEVRGLIGENGSGKSTFSSLLAGVLKKDGGTFEVDGKPYDASSSVAAAEKGVALIMQEIATVESITVAANIYMNKEGRFANKGLIRYKKMYDAARKVLASLGIDKISPETMVRELNLEERKMVEIAKAMVDDPKLLIVDETSNALTKTGRDHLYHVIRQVKESGGSVLFITHDMDEMVQVCDSVTIMRDGCLVTTLFKEEMEPDKIKSLMVGRDLSENFYRSDTAPDYGEEVVLKVEDVDGLDTIHVSFELHEGEILGIGGLSDCGMHELGRALFGLGNQNKGKVTVLPEGREIRSPLDAIRSKIGYLSKNRDTEALLLNTSIRDNICLPVLSKLSKGGVIRTATEREFAMKWVENLHIKCRDTEQYLSALSGGNKQKVVLAKWMGNDSRIMIMDCPTRGIDIGVKESIYRMMEQMKREKKAVIMISEELPELIGMSDRIMIMRGNLVTKVMDRNPEITEQQLIEYMI